MKRTIQDLEVLAIRKQLLKRDAHLRKFGCDLRAGIAFVLAQALPLKSPVLEIGTGKGRFLVRLAKHVERVTTVDLSAEEQRSARLNARYFKVQDRIKFVHQDATRLPWSAHSFGAVVTVNAMHHIRNFEPVLKEMLRVVRPGGKLVLADFSPRGFQNMARAHRAEGKIHPHEHHSFRGLQRSLREHGLTTRLCTGCNEEVLVVLVPAA
jgi:ubiquinone/menaquinone biosynthesis C-methylase UbiE